MRAVKKNHIFHLHLISAFLAAILLLPHALFSSPYSVKAYENFAFPLQQGFPIGVNGSIETSVVFGDVDNDGKMELTFKSNGTYIFNHDGTIINVSWPKIYGAGSPTLADFDDDSELEIVTVDIETNVWKLDGSSFLGWPYLFSNGASYGSAAVDLDRDGYLEVSTGFGAGAGHPHYFTILDYQGNPLSGYPALAQLGGYDNPCVVDLNNDGFYEIVVHYSGDINYQIAAWDLSGNFFNGDWIFDLKAQGLGDLLSDITTADIDGDLQPEIMFGTDLDPGGNGYRHAVILNHDKSFVTGWPKIIYFTLYGGLSAGDIDSDGNLEIACITGGHAEGPDPYLSRLYVWNGEDGSDLPGWPKDILGLSCVGQSVIIGDIDGDCDQELLVACHDNVSGYVDVFAFHHDGSIVKGFPLNINGYTVLWNNNCFITDLDDDGDVEIGVGLNAITGQSRVYVWDLPGAYRPKCPPDWPQYNHDAQHTGNYHHPEGLPVFNVPAITITGFLILLILFTAFFNIRSIKKLLQYRIS